jgi:signal peptidase II
MGKKQVYFWLIPIAIIVLIDEWFKAIGLQKLPTEGSLIDPEIVSFAIHKNWGIAFNIPFKLELIIFFSFVIGALLANVAWRNLKTKPFVSFSSLTIILGSIGNLFDRIYYGFTVDYIIFFGRSAINLSDVIIVSGVIMLLISTSKRKQRRTKKSSTLTDAS